MQNNLKQQQRIGWTKRIAVIALASAVLPAHAAITTAVSGLASYDHLVDFSNPALATDTVVTGQYAGLGLTFAATAGGAVRANGCGIDAFASYGMAGDSLHTYGPGCYTNSVDDSFSMAFDGTVSAASFSLLSNRGDGSHSFTALLDGSVVGSFVHDGATDTPSGSGIIGAWDFTGLSLVFTDMLFDEIRFGEGGSTSGSYMMIDNVAWRSVAGPVAAAVPEPASFALLGLGLVGFAFGRRKARA